MEAKRKLSRRYRSGEGNLKGAISRRYRSGDGRGGAASKDGSPDLIGNFWSVATGRGGGLLWSALQVGMVISVDGTDRQAHSHREKKSKRK